MQVFSCQVDTVVLYSDSLLSLKLLIFPLLSLLFSLKFVILCKTHLSFLHPVTSLVRHLAIESLWNVTAHNAQRSHSLFQL